MNKEQIINEVYENFIDKTKGLNLNLEINKDIIVVEGPIYHATPRLLSQEEFINKCKTDPEFSERWGLWIEERELSFEERWDLSEKYGYRKKVGEMPSETETFNGVNEREEFNSMMNDHVMGTNLPTKLITITYKDTIIESYE